MKLASLLLAAVALCVAAWLCRYQAVSGPRVPFVLDRWTGTVRLAPPLREDTAVTPAWLNAPPAEGNFEGLAGIERRAAASSPR